MPIAITVLAGVLILAMSAGLIWRALDGRRRAGGPTVIAAPVDVRADRAVLLQFSTETCARCPQVRRMLGSVAAELEGVEFAEIDLTHSPEVAAQHRILTTPTTFVIRPDGTLAARFAGVPRRADVEAVVAELPMTQEAR